MQLRNTIQSWDMQSTYTICMGKIQLTMQHITGHQHWSSSMLSTHQKTKISLATFSDYNKILLQLSRQTKWHVNFNSLQSKFFMEKLQVFSPKHSEIHWQDGVGWGKTTLQQKTPQFYCVIFLLNYFAFSFKERHQMTMVRSRNHLFLSWEKYVP